MKMYAFIPKSYDYAFYVMAENIEDALMNAIHEATRERDNGYSNQLWILDKTITKEKLLDKTQYSVQVLDKNQVIYQEVC